MRPKPSATVTSRPSVVLTLMNLPLIISLATTTGIGYITVIEFLARWRCRSIGLTKDRADKAGPVTLLLAGCIAIANLAIWLPQMLSP